MWGDSESAEVEGRAVRGDSESAGPSPVLLLNSTVDVELNCRL